LLQRLVGPKFILLDDDLVHLDCSVYVDAVINHMTGGGSGTGSDGSTFNGDTEAYPGVPYGSSDFNGAAECPTSNLEIQASIMCMRLIAISVEYWMS
jgi:hypothetical protein